MCHTEQITHSQLLHTRWECQSSKHAHKIQLQGFNQPATICRSQRHKTRCRYSLLRQEEEAWRWDRPDSSSRKRPVVFFLQHVQHRVSFFHYVQPQALLWLPVVFYYYVVSVFLCHWSLSILLSHIHHQISPDPRFNHCGTTGVITRPQVLHSNNHKLHCQTTEYMFHCQPEGFIFRPHILVTTYLSDHRLHYQTTYFTVRQAL